MYPISSVAAVFLQVFGLGCVVYLVWQSIKHPKTALLYVSLFVFRIGMIYGCAIAAVKLFPEERPFLTGAFFGLGVLALINWVSNKIRGGKSG